MTVHRIDAGDVRHTDQFVFFWGGWPSQWTLATFVVEGQEYNCAEQWMMASKAALFGDYATLEQIMQTPHPKAQKALGRKVRGYDEKTWADVRFDVVLRGNIEKYRQNPELLRRLLVTDGKLLVEASPYDDVWGIGMGMDDPGLEVQRLWKGQNLLGRAITQARDWLWEHVGEAIALPKFSTSGK